MSLIHEALRKAAEEGGERKDSRASDAALRGLDGVVAGPRRENGGRWAVVAAVVVTGVLCAVMIPLLMHMMAETERATEGLGDAVRELGVSAVGVGSEEVVEPGVSGVVDERVAEPLIEDGANDVVPQVVSGAGDDSGEVVSVADPVERVTVQPVDIQSEAVAVEAAGPIAGAAVNGAVDGEGGGVVLASSVERVVEEAAPVVVGPVLEEGRDYIRTLDVTDAPKLKLTGIAYSDVVRIAFINGATAEAGQNIEGVLVMKVERKRVLMAYKGKAFVLRLP